MTPNATQPHRTRRRGTAWTVAAAAAATLLTGACSNSEEPAGAASATPEQSTESDAAVNDSSEPRATAVDSAALEGSEFTSTDVRGHRLVADSAIAMTFRDGNISVRAGCNTLMGGYSIADGKLDAPQLASTMMACEQDLMDQDQWLAAFLGSGPDITRAGDTLTLTGADDVAIAFTMKA